MHEFGNGADTSPAGREAHGGTPSLFYFFSLSLEWTGNTLEAQGGNH
jgi:hypothetical protein